MPGAVASKCDCHTNKLEKESLVGATKWRIKAQIYESLQSNANEDLARYLKGKVIRKTLTGVMLIKII